MRSNIVKISMALILCLLLSSCGFKDIDKRLFIQAIGVDHSGNEKNPYKVTLKLAIPSGSLKEAGSKYAYISREGSNLAETIRFLKTHVDKELDFGQTKTIILGENILEHDLEDILDFFFRRRDIQMISWVAVGKPSADKVLKVNPKSEMSGSSAFNNLFSNDGVESPYIVTTFLFDARRRVLENGVDAILPIIKANKDQSKLMVNESYAFSGHKKLLKLSSNQTKFYNLMDNGTDKIDIEVYKKNKRFTASIDTAKTKYKIITDANKRPVLKMDITIAGIIEESSFDMHPSDLKQYSKQTAEQTKKEAKKVLKLFQDKGVDPLGFGLRYKATRLNNGKRMEEWKKIYPDLVFDVSVDARIMSTGTIE